MSRISDYQIDESRVSKEAFRPDDGLVMEGKEPVYVLKDGKLYFEGWE